MPKTAEKTKTTVRTTRPPIVVVMGHIDHGKTSLLDYIRKTKVAEREAGGITQGIAAYQVTVSPPGQPSSRRERGISSPEEILRPASSGTQDDFAAAGRKITFIDTPGHETFSAMRARGAHVADIAVLVVAADEGLKPQAEEALKNIQSSEIPFVVAISKIDKPNADPNRIKKELAEKEVLVEGFGGTVPVVELSAKTGQGVESLLETIVLLAELEELTADPSKAGEGVVIESHLDPRRGASATLLVENGTVRRGEFIVIAGHATPVRMFEDFLGKAIDQAGPAEPIRIAGFARVPDLGERFRVFARKPEAQAAAEEQSASAKVIAGANGPTPDGLRRIVEIVLKADTRGSLEAIENAIAAIGSAELGNQILKSEVGDISETDVKTAAASKRAFIVGFNVAVPALMRELAERSGIPIVADDIIYKVLDGVRETMVALAPVEVRRVDLGTAKILARFKDEKSKQIVGGKVETGKIQRGASFDIIRNQLVIGTGRIIELQQARSSIAEVLAGNEFGVLVEAAAALAPGDTLAVFSEEKLAARL